MMDKVVLLKQSTERAEEEHREATEDPDFPIRAHWNEGIWGTV